MQFEADAEKNRVFNQMVRDGRIRIIPLPNTRIPDDFWGIQDEQAISALRSFVQERTDRRRNETRRTQDSCTSPLNVAT